MVAQNCILPYRGFAIRRALDWSDAWPNAIRRYSRLQICATCSAASRTALAQGGEDLA